MKEKDFCPGRRNFIKTTAAGSVALAAQGILPEKAEAQGNAPDPAWKTGRQLHPDIANERVVFCHDEGMVGPPPANFGDWAAQNNSINAKKVAENLDKMAIALADLEVTDPDDIAKNAEAAWAHIFRMPAGKSAWADVNVAFKVNCIARVNMVRLAIIDKVAQALIKIGIQGRNMVIFDGSHGSNGYERYDTQYSKERMPQGVYYKKSAGRPNDSDTYSTKTTMPDGESVACPPRLMRNNPDKIDILINCCVNKGHSSSVGGFTLALKNHYGTLRMHHNDPPRNGIDTLIAMNQSPEILGGDPPVQQLVILDSLYASVPGPVATPDHAPKVLIMGTFGLTVDLMAVRKIRENREFMNINSNRTNNDVVNRFLRAFGYVPDSNMVREMDMLDALTFEPRKKAVGTAPAPVFKAIRMGLPALSRPGEIRFELDGRESLRRMGIYNLKGRLLRSFGVPRTGADGLSFDWDGKDMSGAMLPSGSYVVKLDLGARAASKIFVKAL